MKVSLEWLSEYLKLEVEPEELACMLDLSGTAVDRIIRIGTGLSGVVVGRVVEVQPHPNADSLSVAHVEDGSNVREVVCGAPNLVSGMRTAFALPGARLPAISTSELKRANIRGVASDGMLLSAAELGIGEDTSGIIELGQDVLVGADIHDVLPVEDVVLDLEITPNRPDCMSMIGIAREISALLNLEFNYPEIEIIEDESTYLDSVKVKVGAPGDCQRYTARLVSDVKISPSPSWMQRRLMAAGFRAINNVVDVTNYVLVELGQPLHAFDLERIEGKTIIVRHAERGEVIRTLDGEDRQLDEKSLVIADSSNPVAIAGIMGGENSEVTEQTKNVLIESACFEPTSIYLTSKRFGLRSESSSRFERGTDPIGTSRAARRAAQLISQISGGRIALGEIDIFPGKKESIFVELRPWRLNELLGVEISKTEITNILERLEFKISSGETLNVEVPSFRRDIEREIDLVEEVARIFGYNKIPSDLPKGGRYEAGLSKTGKIEREISNILIAQGLFECISPSFMQNLDLTRLRLPEGHALTKVVTLLNPLSETGECMRTSLMPGLLKIVRHNQNRGNKDLAIFETGRVFFSAEGNKLPIEMDCIGILLSGMASSQHWSVSQREFDFFDLKGIVENILHTLFIGNYSLKKVERPFLKSGRGSMLQVEGKDAGFLGELKSEVVEAYDIKGHVYVAEISTDCLIQAAGEPEHREIGRFPGVKVDISIIVDDGVECERVENIIRANGGELLESVSLFDLYKGTQIPDGMKSLAFSLEFRSFERTLSDEDVNERVDSIVSALERDVGAVLRKKDEGPSGSVRQN
ncbi:MAG: phenylalanine--tRNA ligase subunit beta [Actinomycetota bacterium]|nr:phenylalanine--tRNA ligase subunit beta [Actinomycetota bacterium]